MGAYLLRRFLVFVPTLFVILLLSFVISRNVPGDPVMTELIFNHEKGGRTDRKKDLEEYIAARGRLGLDKPIFYFALTSLAYPDTLYRIPRLSEREGLEELIAKYGNWPEISAYYQAVCTTEEIAFSFKSPAELKNDHDEVRLALSELRYLAAEKEIEYRFELIDSLCRLYPGHLADVFGGFGEIRARYAAIQQNKSVWKLYVPALSIYGSNNQFHHWLSRMLHFDFGRSNQDNQEVSVKIMKALPWTVFMGLFSYLIAYMIAIPVGVFAVRNRNKWQDRAVTTGLFLLYSVPSFVMAMFLITLFCNPDFFTLFPTSGINSDGSESWPFFQRMIDHAWHLTLPTLVYSYGSIAFLSRQMRVGMIETVNQDYIRTARAKGLPEKTVIWRHALRNSLLPIITHLAGLLPHIIAGAIIIETIFSVPGMGRLTVMAIHASDHSTVVAVFGFSAVLTLLGILIADILYAFADPRISFTKR